MSPDSVSYFTVYCCLGKAGSQQVFFFSLKGEFIEHIQGALGYVK